MGKIYLVRHGQSEDNAAGVLGGQRDSGLTGLGRRQAEHMAEELAGMHIGAIISSPLQRAYDTAAIIARQLGIGEIKTDESLRERDFGVLTGHPYADVEKMAEEIIFVEGIGYFLEVPGAETFPQLLARARGMLEGLKEGYEDKDILLVAHSDIGKMIRAAYNGWSWEEGLRSPNIGNSDAYELTEGITIHKESVT